MKVKKKSCVSLLADLLCSTQIIVYAKNSVFAFFKRTRFNLGFYLNTIQKTEGSLLRWVKRNRGQRSSKVLFLFVE